MITNFLNFKFIPIYNWLQTFQQNYHKAGLQMSQSQPVQPHQQDDCDDCRKQRAQNNQLIDFYERVNKLKTKVIEIKPQIVNHSSASKDQRAKLEKISNKMVYNPNLISDEFNKLDSKEMGYQLTCALLQRELKMKRQNQKLSQRIRDLKTINQNTQQTIKKTTIKKKDCQMQSDPQTQIFNGSKISNIEPVKLSNIKMKESKSLFSDSLDNALEDNNKSFWGTYQVSPLRSQRSREQNSRYSQSFAAVENQKDSSTFSSFQDTGRTIFNKTEQNPKKKFQNLNLWLYQINTEEQLPKNQKTKNRLLKKK